MSAADPGGRATPATPATNGQPLIELAGVRKSYGLGTPVVTEVLHTPGGELLSIRTESGAEVLVPFVTHMVPTVSLADGLVEIDPPDGLLELD